MIFLSDIKTIWDFLLTKIGNPYGVAGLMGNLFAESGLSPINLQNTHEKKFGMSDQEYTNAVDSGIYKNFVNDSAGYGLAQWTYYSRKQDLFDYTREKRVSIGNLNAQLEFLIKELSTKYTGVFDKLKSARSVQEASDIVLTQYERPANQNATVKATRAAYGQKYFDEYSNISKKGGNNTMKTSKAVVDTVNSWIGKKESDGSYKSIIDEYNKVGPFPRNTKMAYGWAWCACTWSAIAKKLGYTDIMPIEISCYYIIEAAKKMGVWIEADNTVPKPGYAVIYDWDDTGAGDNTGNPDHIGTVVEVYPSAGYFVVTEGNYSNSVKKRTVSINGRYIRGFIAPKYDSYNAASEAPQTAGKDVKTIAREVIAGTWGSGEDRKTALTKAGYNYSEVQNMVNEILNEGAIKQTQTAAQKNKKLVASDAAQKFDKSIAGTYVTNSDLYLRHGAGTNKKAMICMGKNTSVSCYGYYSLFNGVKWYYVAVTIDGVEYQGFCSSKYLKKK